MISLESFLRYSGDCIALIGVAVILSGALRTVWYMVHHFFANQKSLNSIRLELGNSIVLGLEFMIGADIIESLLKPDYYSLGMLAIIVVIRSFLSYVLTLELDALKPSEKHLVK